MNGYASSDAQAGMAAGASSVPASEWRSGYPVVITSFFGLGIAVLASWSIGLFLEPIEADTGWGRGAISAGLMMIGVVGFIGSPFVGMLIDRIGVRKVGLTGMTLYCIALGLLGLSGSEVWQWLALWLFLAFGYMLIKPTLWAVAISQRFDRQRALAIAVAMSGSGVLLIVMPVALNAIIADFGWRMSYFILAAGSAILTLPLMFLFLKDNRNLERSGKGSETAAEIETRAMTRQELKRDFRSGRYIRLLTTAILITIVIVGLQVHFIPLLGEQGVDRTTAAMIAGVIGFGSITGRLLCGYLMDRWRGQIVGAAFFALPAVSSIFLLNYDGNVAVGCAIAFTQGLALGAEIDVMAYLMSRYFGLKNYGTLFGTLVGFLVIGNGMGPTIAGWVFDVAGSYQPFILFAIPSFLVCSFLIGTMGDYPRHDSHSQA